MATGNLVQGNYIGTDQDGRVALRGGPLANSTGVLIQGAADNTLGGGLAAGRNVIVVQGRNSVGVYLFDGASSNVVRGNFIGTDAAGRRLNLGRRAYDYGVLLFNAADNPAVDKRSGGATKIVDAAIASFREFTGAAGRRSRRRGGSGR
jgi:hypothetical protein